MGRWVRVFGTVGPWLEHRKAFRREVRCGSLGESLFHLSSTAGLQEQRQSMVLELYCRKAERKRRKKEREAGHDHLESRGKGIGRDKEQGSKRQRREARVRE